MKDWRHETASPARSEATVLLARGRAYGFVQRIVHQLRGRGSETDDGESVLVASVDRQKTDARVWISGNEASDE